MRDLLQPIFLILIWICGTGLLSVGTNWKTGLGVGLLIAYLKVTD